ncbi:MAG: hypothetical protein H8E44_18000 [Planctomycetes bacterium]|nr:hypothetical protein [Planctomycetota bacterium]
MCEQFAKPYGTLATVDEELDVPGRSYHVIRNFQGKILAEEYTPECSVREPQVNLDGTAWLVSGTPVLWDGDDNELYDRMITDAADPAHVWRLPRGNHPDASPITRASWNELHRVFVETLANNRDDAAARLKEAAKGLQREDEYLHCVWGVGRPDELIIIIAHGRLEKLGRMAQELGAKRAICVENGGSIAFYYVPTNDQQEWSPLIRAPNLRPAGTAFAFFKLSDAHFACAKR